MPKLVTEEYLDHRLDGLEKRFDATFVTKDEFHSRLDEVVTILRRLDQERIFTIEWIRRIESDVDRIKAHLKLV